MNDCKKVKFLANSLKYGPTEFSPNNQQVIEVGRVFISRQKGRVGHRLTSQIGVLPPDITYFLSYDFDYCRRPTTDILVLPNNDEN